MIINGYPGTHLQPQLLLTSRTETIPSTPTFPIIFVMHGRSDSENQTNMTDYSPDRDSHESGTFSRSSDGEFEEKLLFTGSPGQERQRKTSRSVLVALWRATVTVLALGWIIPLAKSTYREHELDSSSFWPKPALSPLPEDVFRTVKKTFYPDESYIGPSNETHRNWDHLVAAHDALYIADPDTYGLPEGIPPPFDHPNKVIDGPHKFYVIAGLHQMHCLVSRHQYRGRTALSFGSLLIHRISSGFTTSRPLLVFLDTSITAKRRGKLTWSTALSTSA